MAKTHKGARRAKANRRPRASWRGNLAFGLVTFPVEAFNAIDRTGSDIHLNQLHAACHRRIKYQKICPVHGEVSNDEVVSGFEYKKGRYVEIEPEELDAAGTQAERALTIDAFVEPEAVDPLYFDGRMYYLFPGGATAEEPYAVLAEALAREKKVGIGQVVFSGKDQLVLLRPMDGVLHMAMLNYEAEIRPADEVRTPPQARRAGRHLKLAQTLIRDWSDEGFDFSDYKDHYRERLQELIDAKLAGRETVRPGAEEEAPEVVNLMEALKRSVAQSAAAGRDKRRPTKRRRPA